jgi:hypothetical protein
MRIAIGADQLFGRDFGGGIGATRIMGGLFVEPVGVIQFEMAKDLIRRDVMETLDLAGAALGLFEKVEGPDDVGLKKNFSAFDGAVNVGFGRKVDYDISAFHGTGDIIRVPDISMDKGVARFVDAFEVLEVTGVGQRVEIHYEIVRMASQPKADEIRPNKSGAAGDEEFHMA